MQKPSPTITPRPTLEIVPDVRAAAAQLADLDTLRNGVAWLGSELDRVKAWAGLWKRAAKRSARDWRDLVAAYEDMRAENAAVRRAARQLVVAWRKERADRLSGAETNENSPDHPTV